ncbi:MAG: hypothetical protein MUE42_02645 [Opitutaceae bacterium]|jgi:hypothetical protein|nr:hypothetical protein [Opitutaceae bacterium]
MIAAPSPSLSAARTPLWLGLAAGVALLVAAWLVPVHLRALAPALLTAAGEGTPTLAELGEAKLEEAQPGAAALLLAGSKAAGVAESETGQLERALKDFAQREPALMPWGGEDPFLAPLTRQPAARAAAERGESVPVLRFFVTAEARASLRGFLENSRLAAVRDTLALGTLQNTGRFVPANRAGGQAYEALILLAALLQQGEHLSPALAREWREAARAAGASGELGAFEPVLVDLLALGRRLDWRQLTAVAGAVETRETWAELGALARAGGAEWDVVLAATLVDDSAERVARFRRGQAEDPDADLRLALAEGQGAVRLLLQRGVPVNRQSAPAPGALVSLALLHPGWALALRFALCAAGAYLGLRALDRAMRGGAARDQIFHVRSGALALVATGVFIVVTEPYLGRAAPVRIEGLTLAMPVLGNLADPDSLKTITPSFAMDTHSLLAIALFGALQIAMYLVCLAKIRDIDAQALAPLVKLRLMENEENLFDGGLYLGIGGTATALVLQVLGLVEPNLLAAYSSNLLGITCVALVKIRHVRPFKTKLILAAQDALAAGEMIKAR